MIHFPPYMIYMTFTQIRSYMIPQYLYKYIYPYFPLDKPNILIITPPISPIPVRIYMIYMIYLTFVQIRSYTIPPIFNVIPSFHA